MPYINKRVFGRELIYLASPYSHKDKRIRERRFQIACEVAAQLIKEGSLVYSPIIHSHNIVQVGKLEVGWDFWKEFDTRMILCCDYLGVLTIPGWEKSKGVAEEIKFARENYIRVYHVSRKGEVVYVPE